MSRKPAPVLPPRPIPSHPLQSRLPPSQGRRVPPIISIRGLTKTYASGFQALKNIDLEIHRGEIFALLGPNGAGKTTLINIICGIVNPTSGTVLADGHDIVSDYRAARTKIGLVPQELSTDAFESVWATVNFSRGLFGKPRDTALCERLLRELSLWDKKDGKIMTLSGGMKRRVMIAKALSHEPQILFLDEPSAGVDVELRRDMWEMVRGLRASGFRRNSPAARSNSPPPATSSSTPSTPRAKNRVSRRCCARSAGKASASRICSRRRARSKTFSSAW